MINHRKEQKWLPPSVRHDYSLFVEGQRREIPQNVNKLIVWFIDIPFPYSHILLFQFKFIQSLD